MAINSLVDVAIHSVFDVGILLFCNWILFIALQKLRTCGYINYWVLLFFGAAYTPVLCVLWVTGLFSIYHQLTQNDSFDLVIQYIDQIQYIALTIPFCWFLFRLKSLIVKSLIEKYEDKAPNFDPILISIFSKLATVSLFLLSLTLVFQIIGVPLDTFMIFRGAFSIALALAAQNIVVL